MSSDPVDTLVRRTDTGTVGDVETVLDVEGETRLLGDPCDFRRRLLRWFGELLGELFPPLLFFRLPLPLLPPPPVGESVSDEGVETRRFAPGECDSR